MSRCPWCGRHRLLCAAVAPGNRERGAGLSIPSRSARVSLTTAGLRFAGYAASKPATPGRRSSP